MPPKKREAVSATSAVDDAPTTRTRATKSARNVAPPVSEPTKTEKVTTSDSTAVESSSKVAPKRGRPPKAAVATEPAASENTTAPRRGRPPKAVPAAAEPTPPKAKATTKRARPANVTAEPNDETSAAPEPARKRGRPAKVVSAVTASEKEPAVPKKRGRPAKEVPTKPSATTSDPEPQPKKKRGRPAKEQVSDEPQAKKPRGSPVANNKVKLAANVKPIKSQATGDDRGGATAILSANDGAETDAIPPANGISDAKSYWLMKAEPDSRMETAPSGKQVDLKFTIDDLKAKGGPEPWDGIRNHQAQKNLRAMKVGDLCFFAESNCKIPGLVGIMEVVGESRPDPAQFDRDSIYYDEKATEAKPRWNCVMVEFRCKFSQKLPTSILKSSAGSPSDPLHGMQLFRQSRLSVSKVESAEWEYILELVEQHVSKMDETADKKPDSAVTTGKKMGRKSAVTFVDSTPTKPADGTHALDTKTPTRYRKTPAKPSSAPADSAERPEVDHDPEIEAETEPATKTPRPRKARADVSASEPKPTGKKTPATKAASGVPATEPRPRGRPPGSKNKSTATKTTPAAADDPMDLDANPETIKTPAAPASESKKSTKSTPDAKSTTAPKTEPRPRGRPAKAKPAVDEAKATTNGDLLSETPGPQKSTTNVPQTEPRPRGRPKKTAAEAESAMPKTAPRPRGRPPGSTNKAIKPATAAQSAAKGKRTALGPSTDKADTALASLEPTPSKVAPSEDATATVAAEVAEAATEAGLDQGSDGLQISIEEPTELSMADGPREAGETSWPDIQDVTGQSVGSAELLADVAEVTSPEAGVMPSTESPARSKTSEPGRDEAEAETGLAVEEGRRGFFGRLSEGLVNVIASPGRAISRALSGTPGPEEERSAVKGAEMVEGLDIVKEEEEEGRAQETLPKGGMGA